MKPSSAGALQNLVTQFATPFDSVRELVQNSIDAGTSSIEVWCDYEYTDNNGVLTIHIDDFGEGMDENIIDNQLTKLFASAKENDLTKIGKFGIGFVSVFALNPAGVLLRTGRGGEYWEVFFHPDRSYTKTKIDNPVEGTQITIFLEGSPAYYDVVVAEVRGSLKKWCLYAEPEISFENRADPMGEIETINQEFGVQGLCSIIDEHDDGTQIAVAFSNAPHYAFFNRGLTLAMSQEAVDLYPPRSRKLVEGLSVQIKSRYLEHTLSRDSVVRDANFEKAMRLLEKTVNEELLCALFHRLQSLATQKNLNPLEAREYGQLLAEAARFSEESLSNYLDLPCIRLLHGDPISPKAVFKIYKSSGRIPFGEDPTPLTLRASESNIPTLWLSPPLLLEQINTLTLLANFSAPYSIWAILKTVFGAKVDIQNSDFNVASHLFYDIEILKKSAFQNIFFERVLVLLATTSAYFKHFGEDNLKLAKIFPPREENMGFIFTKVGSIGIECISEAYRDRVMKHDLLINVNHPVLKKILALAEVDLSLAAYMLASAIAGHHSMRLNETRQLVENASRGLA